MRILFLLFALLSFNSAYATEQACLGCEEKQINSKVFKTERKFIISLPDEYTVNTEETYPVIYLLDGKHYINQTQGITSGLNSNILAPKFILVGLVSGNRVADFTPTHVESRKGSGGADDFLNFIATELMPYVDSNYRTSGFNVLTGHSLGGLFVLHALQARPDLFNAHFAYSPSLYWDNQVTVKTFNSFLAKQKAIKKFLYMNMGNEGYRNGVTKPGSMRDGFIKIQKQLQQSSVKEFRYVDELLEDEVHGSTQMIGLFRGIRTLYRHWNLPNSTIDEGVAAIKAHFKALSNDLDKEYLPTYDTINYAGGYSLWGKKDEKAGISYFKYNISLFPDMAEVYFDLANAYKHINKYEEALAQIKLAIDKSETNTQQFRDYQQFQTELEQKLAN